MPTSKDADMEGRKVEDIKRLLSEKRFEEAFDLSTALTKEAPGNAEGWWRLTLAAKGLKRWEFARIAVKETINLVPGSPMVWCEFGDILEALEQDDQARKAFEKALSLDPGYSYGHLSLVYNCARSEDYDGVVYHGQAFERIEQPNANVLDKMGLAFWHKKQFDFSLHYYTRSAATEKEAFRYNNLGLLYGRPELGQYLDASDAYCLALLIEPRNERALQESLKLSEKLSSLARAVKQNGSRVLRESLGVKEFYRFYINPFVLLGCDVTSDIGDYTTKAIQRLKKNLVQEIDLEAGQVESLGRHAIDKSRALGLCDELLDDTKKRFHWVVFQDRRLLDFLHTGGIALFTYDKNYFPIGTLNALEELAFRSWLSEFFSQQYDLVLSRTLDQNNLAAIGALVSGRRYVVQQDEDRCFASVKRLIDRRIEPVRSAEREANTNRPSLAALSHMLSDPKNASALAPLLNLLPFHFKSYQDEAVRLIRSIAIDCNNKHSDPDLAKEILELASAFSFVGVDVKNRVEEDKQRVDEIIAKESEHEVRLTQGGQPLQITREGVRRGAASIALKDLKAARWGMVISSASGRRSADFHVSVQSNQGTEITIGWNTSIDLDKSNEFYSQIIDALFAYAIPPILQKIEADLDNGERVLIGACELNSSCVTFLAGGWFGKKVHEVPWPRIHTEVANGELIVSDRANSKIRISMPIRTTYNAVAISIIAASRGKQK